MNGNPITGTRESTLDSYIRCSQKLEESINSQRSTTPWFSPNTLQNFSEGSIDSNSSKSPSSRLISRNSFTAVHGSNNQSSSSISRGSTIKKVAPRSVLDIRRILNRLTKLFSKASPNTKTLFATPEKAINSFNNWFSTGNPISSDQGKEFKQDLKKLEQELTQAGHQLPPALSERLHSLKQACRNYDPAAASSSTGSQGPTVALQRPSLSRWAQVKNFFSVRKTTTPPTPRNYYPPSKITPDQRDIIEQKAQEFFDALLDYLEKLSSLSIPETALEATNTKAEAILSPNPEKYHQ